MALAGAAEARGAFCCAGCEHVFDVLSRLDESTGARYFEAARRMGLVPPDSSLAKPQPAPDVLPEDPSAMREDRVACGGLSCPSCAWVIEQVLLSDPGVAAAEADYFTATGRVRYDLRRTSLDHLNQLLAPLGHTIERLGDEGRTGPSRRSTMTFVVAAVLTMNIMTLAFVRYAERIGWLDEAPAFLAWLEMLLTVPVLYLGWVPTVRRAWAGLRAGRMTMDLLIAIAVGAATMLSIAALLSGRQDIYFETAAGLVTIFLFSRMIEARLRARAFGELSGLLRIRPVHARRITHRAGESFVPVDAIGPGDAIALEPGEDLPFDGEVRGPPVLVSEAMLTGEPTPVRKGPGDRVLAGSRVVEGRLEMVVLRRFEETRLFQITESLAGSLKSSEQRLRAADRISAWFVPTVLVVALGAWLVRLGLYGWSFALGADGWFPSVAVLAVACPCAFSLAGIAAVTAATGALLQKGLLVVEPRALEVLSQITEVVFDKTGTVTEGLMTVDRIAWRGDPDAALLPMVLASEVGSTHPVAQAIRAYFEQPGLPSLLTPDSALETRPGTGRVASFGGRRFCVGSAALFDGPFAPEGMTDRHSAVWFGFEGTATGCFLLTDKLRPEAGDTVRRLADFGLSTALLSGDRAQVTERVAKEIGVEAWMGDMSMADKVAYVEAKQAAGQGVCFVGDGTNDALAMGESMVSVALPRSTDEALKASGFVLLGGDLRRLGDLVGIGRKLTRVIRANHLWAFGFNTLFIPVAALGRLVPLAAMLLMLVSSTAVLLNSLRAKRV